MIRLWYRKTLFAPIVLLLAVSLSAAQEMPSEDLGVSGLLQSLTELKTTGRLLHSTAHPDDDDGSMLVYESRGQGNTTLMLTLNRGEGGQNKVGSELFDELGILRTLELLEAGRYYGNQQRFTRVVDFGFSKNSAETFQQWGGHDTALRDMVRVIRQFRPDVIISRFAGDPRDGHGNHQAAGILSREAFHAAADPGRFPELMQEGLLPWQVKKLYIGNLRGGHEKEFTTQLDAGAYDPVLGMSYWQYSLEGLQHQASQGVGAWSVPSGPSLRGYKLVESTLPPPKGLEKSFFDGIDTSIPGLASRVGDEQGKVPFLRPALVSIAQSVDTATDAFEPHDPSRCAPALLNGLAQVRDVLTKVRASSLSAAAKAALVPHLETKVRQFEKAANLALGTQLTAAVDSAEDPSPSPFFRQEQTFLTAVPGQTFTITAKLYNRGGQSLVLQDISLELPQGWKSERLKAEMKPLGSNETASAQFRITVPQNPQYTRPYWTRKDTSQSVYDILDPEYATLALPPWPVRVRASYALAPLSATGNASPAVPETGSIEAVAQVKYVDPVDGQMDRPLAVGPPLSVEVEPPVQVVSTQIRSAIDLAVNVRNNVDGAAKATVRLEAPTGWKIEPASQNVDFKSESELKTLSFRLQPLQLQEKRYELNASADYQGRSYKEGVETIGRPDIGYFYYYRPAQQVISAVDVNTQSRLRVGYIMGAGDDIPAVLGEIGIPVTILTPGQLAHGDLNQFDTIIVGIRAYDVRSDIREQNSRLLNYVHNGGTLVVQYNQGTREFNAGHYAPYAVTASNERVTEEDAPVEILDPRNSIFTFPNQITARDFQGWVQERGLYFMKDWDQHFVPLTASSDAKEQPLKGGLLVASYGKGTYIYTGYAFFRQLPAGVPGAIRLFVNLLSAGHAAAATGASQ